MKRVKISKTLGIWFYTKFKSYDMEHYTYELYNEKKEYIATFPFYDDMLYYIETKTII